MSMTRTTRRVARKRHRCGVEGWRYQCRVIQPGEVYLEHVSAPGHEDIGNTHWLRCRECSDCATRYGRANLLGAP